MAHAFFPIIAQSLLEARLGQIIDLLTNPLAVLPAIALTICLMLIGFSERHRFLLVIGIVFFSCLAPFTTNQGEWIPPPSIFAQAVIYGRIVTLGLMLLLLPGFLLAGSRYQTASRISPLAWSIFAMYAVFCLRYAVTPHALQGLSRLATYILVFIVYCHAIPRVIYDLQSLRRWLEAALWGVSIFAISSVGCEILQPGSVSWHSRLYGLSGNPNSAGMYLALATPAFLGAITWPDSTRARRVATLLLWCFALAVILWTGSRASMATAAICVLAFYRLRIGRLLFVAVPMVILVYFAAGWLGISESAAGRITNFSDTRTAGWKGMLDAWAESPIFGNAELAMAVTENSYLTVAANTGVIGILALIAVLAIAAAFLVQAARTQSPFPHTQVAGNIAFAGVAGLLIASIFEGLLLSNLTCTGFWIYFYIGIGSIAITAQLPFGQPGNGFERT